MGAAERLRRAVFTGVPVVISSPPALSITPRFEKGQRVHWYEGRTRKLRRGFIQTVYPVPGWPHEYDVQLLRRDGSAGRISRKYQSQLEVSDA
jgi:hypothetical protein